MNKGFKSLPNEGGLRAMRDEDAVRLGDLCVPLSLCVCVKPGPVDAQILHTLEDERYDQAPVYDQSTHMLWGLVETSHLKHLDRSGTQLTLDDSQIRKDIEFEIHGQVSIFSILEFLRDRRAMIVTHYYESEEHGEVGFFDGLFTISDLNRHAVRGALYRLLADIEWALARFVEREAPNPLSWLKHLSEEHQVRVLGYWELARQREIDIGPLAALTLTNLMQIVSKFENLATKLSYASRTQFKEATAGVPDVRNRVMHSVRPLVLAQADVARLCDISLSLEQLRERIEGVLGDNVLGPDGPHDRRI